MLVKLYELPPLEGLLGELREHGVEIRRAIAPEKHVVAGWVRERFRELWVSECEVAFGHVPVSCFVAVDGEKMVGFACYDTTRRGFFGPTGVDESVQGRGIGTALLLACLHSMWVEGYGYAIIGGAGPVDFYAKVCGATVIEGSNPGVYRGMLRGE
jgi:GNAT superfamily N-acetyltransferase